MKNCHFSSQKRSTSKRYTANKILVFAVDDARNGKQVLKEKIYNQVLRTLSQGRGGGLN